MDWAIYFCLLAIKYLLKSNIRKAPKKQATFNVQHLSILLGFKQLSLLSTFLSIFAK
jgi:hypothetical protein